MLKSLTVPFRLTNNKKAARAGTLAPTGRFIYSPRSRRFDQNLRETPFFHGCIIYPVFGCFSQWLWVGLDGFQTGVKAFDKVFFSAENNEIYIVLMKGRAR
jgi:hypothetical protein